jgi:hypothetical protein
MNYHEREFFVSRIRTGKTFVSIGKDTVCVMPPSIEDGYRAALAYKESYAQSIEEELITEREMQEWMRMEEMWTTDDDIQEKKLAEDLESMKVEAYQNRQDKKTLKGIKRSVFQCVKSIEGLVRKKASYVENTCEGLALIAKAEALIELCTHKDGLIYDFEKLTVSQVHNEYNRQLCTEQQTRELARSEPWKSLWTMKELSTNLFAEFTNPRDMSVDQKNLVIWSRIYDNVQESMECPPSEVIKDDIVLDGWFIVQRRERDKQAVDKDFDSGPTNEKIKNSQEVIMIARDQEHAKSINDMNDAHVKQVKRDRSEVLKRGDANQHDFPDEKLRLANMARDQMKEHFRRK